MISVKVCNKDKEVGYPCLKISSNGIIVLFISKNTGTLLEKGETKSNVGEYSTCWSEFCFKPLESPITLENVKG